MYILELQVILQHDLIYLSQVFRKSGVSVVEKNRKFAKNNLKYVLTGGIFLKYREILTIRCRMCTSGFINGGTRLVFGEVIFY